MCAAMKIKDMKQIFVVFSESKIRFLNLDRGINVYIYLNICVFVSILHTALIRVQSCLLTTHGRIETQTSKFLNSIHS